MDATDPQPATFLVFGDLHGRVLPAFRLASCWARDHGRPLAGVLQVGDLGYFPDLSRLDKATLRHAKDDPLELGTLDVVQPNELADRAFDDPHAPPGLWFTAGNHEDFDELERLARSSGRQPDFVVDAYGRVRGIKDGEVLGFADGPRAGAVWGVDGDGPHARQNLPPRGYIQERAIDRLLAAEFDVLLSHDGPADAKRVGYGSELLRHLVELAQPAFSFFGHYGGDGGREEVDAYFAHLGADVNDGLVRCGIGVDNNGVLARNRQWRMSKDDWLKTFTRHNWKWR